jgi:stage V sporulation protein AD
LKKKDIDFIVSGDLLNQCCGSSYGIKDMNIPFFGVFGACSTIGEAMSVGSILIDGGGAEKVIASASSHFCSAEKQFRFPLELGNQRPPSSTWTVTGDGAVLLTNEDKPPYIRCVTAGKIVDFGITDANNMGAAMAPAAADVIYNHLKDTNRTPDYYDLIITGDLGYIGKSIVTDLLAEKGIDIIKNYSDCGIEIYNKELQDTHSGGSGCACSAITFCGMLYNKLKSGKMNKLLFVPTGALMSPTSVQQGENICGIAYAVEITN